MEKVKQLLEAEIEKAKTGDIDYYFALLDTYEYVMSSLELEARKPIKFIQSKEPVIDGRIPF